MVNHTSLKVRVARRLALYLTARLKFWRGGIIPSSQLQEARISTCFSCSQGSQPTSAAHTSFCKPLQQRGNSTGYVKHVGTSCNSYSIPPATYTFWDLQDDVGKGSGVASSPSRSMQEGVASQISPLTPSSTVLLSDFFTLSCINCEKRRCYFNS